MKKTDMTTRNVLLFLRKTTLSGLCLFQSSKRENQPDKSIILLSGWFLIGWIIILEAYIYWGKYTYTAELSLSQRTSAPKVSDI